MLLGDPTSHHPSNVHIAISAIPRSPVRSFLNALYLIMGASKVKTLKATDFDGSWMVLVCNNAAPCSTTVLLDPFQDAITGSSARVCMVAAVHPAHPVETAPGPLKWHWQSCHFHGMVTKVEKGQWLGSNPVSTHRIASFTNVFFFNSCSLIDLQGKHRGNLWYPHHLLVPPPSYPRNTISWRLNHQQVFWGHPWGPQPPPGPPQSPT